MDVVNCYNNPPDTTQEVGHNEANDQVNSTGEKGYLQQNNKNIFPIVYFI